MKKLTSKKYDGFVKSPYIVIPAKAGIQNYLILLDPGLRRGDAIRKISTFYEAVKYGPSRFFRLETLGRLTLTA